VISRTMRGTLSTLGVCLSLCMGALRIADAAPRGAAEDIVAQAREAYAVPVETGSLAAAVSSALDAGVPLEETRALVVGAAREDRSPSEIASLLTQIADYRRGGLPTSAALNTVLEGIAKDASPEAIEEALRTTKRNVVFSVSLAERHRTGKRGEAKRNDLLVKAAALALDAGFDEGDLERVSEAARQTGNGPDYFLACLQSLLELGSTPLQSTSRQKEKIAGLVALAARKRFSVKDLSRLSGLVASKLAEQERENAGRAVGEREISPFDVLLAEMEKSERPSDFFAAAGYGAQPGPGRPPTGSGPSSGSGTAGSSGGSPGGSGSGGSQGGSTGGGTGGGSQGGGGGPSGGKR
jgi:hypothetical protein